MTNKYESLEFWQSLLGDYTLHNINMGLGSILEDDLGNIYVFLPSNKIKLECGCPGSESFQLIDDKLVHLHLKSKTPNIKRIYRFQGSKYDHFWEKFYQKNPELKPMRVNN